MNPFRVKISVIHSRINLLLYVTGLIFLLMLILLLQTSLHQEKLFLQSSRSQLQNENRSMVENRTELLQQVVYDNTFWDDFVNHLTPHDTNWYENNITTLLKSFKIDYVAVFDTTFKLVHEANSEEYNCPSLINSEMLERLKEKKFLNFFLKKPEGLYEIASASVHPESDPTHQLTRARGYLVLARCWNNAFLDSLSKQHGAVVSIVSSGDTTNIHDKTVTNAYFPLNDFNGQEIALVSFKRTSNLLVVYRRISLFMILTMLASIIITWLLLNFTMRKWVTRPLKLVTEILKTEDASLVSELKKCPGEYKKIGILFSDFVNQKNELLIAKEKAEESDMLKSTFLANMSHEIRTPMNGILGFVELLKEPKLSGEEQLEYIDIIAESGQRMLNIINDIISISKLEAGHTEIVITETNVNDQVRYIYTFFKPEAEKHGIEFNYKQGLPDHHSHILTDREKLYAILTNLVKNAVKFTHKGSIELGYEQKGAFLEFFVRDTGVGIREEQQHIVFERFRQANESLSRHYEGAGLGLAISKAYVTLLGGKIWVNSELNKGSSFYFTVPYNPISIFANTSISAKHNTREGLNIQGLKILVAEDDPISDLFLQKMIRNFAKEVLKVVTGDEAVETCRQNPDIDLILMDIQMPGMDGYEATRQIRQFNTKVIILAQTALALKGERENALEAGCNDYLSKPISVDDFSNLIRMYFENRV